MFSTFALALMLAMQSNVGASAVFSSYFDGQRFDFHVTQQDIENSPRWLDTDDSPPLPPRAAIQSARILLWQLVNYADKWRLVSVKIQPVVPLAFPDVWIYLVEFAPPPSPGGGPFATISVVVLMNGSAVVPIVSKWPAEH